MLLKLESFDHILTVIQFWYIWHKQSTNCIDTIQLLGWQKSHFIWICW